MKSSLSLLQLFLVGLRPTCCTWKPAHDPEGHTGDAADAAKASLRLECGEEGARPKHKADQGLDTVQDDGSEATPGLDEARSEAPSKVPDQARGSQQQDNLQADGKVKSGDDAHCEHVFPPDNQIQQP